MTSKKVNFLSVVALVSLCVFSGVNALPLSGLNIFDAIEQNDLEAVESIVNFWQSEEEGVLKITGKFLSKNKDTGLDENCSDAEFMEFAIRLAKGKAEIERYLIIFWLKYLIKNNNLADIKSLIKNCEIKVDNEMLAMAKDNIEIKKILLFGEVKPFFVNLSKKLGEDDDQTDRKYVDISVITINK